MSAAGPAAGTLAPPADAEVTEVLAATAPPSRVDGGAKASRPERDADLLAGFRIPRSRGGGGARPPRRRGRLPLPAPSQKAPRDGRWWAGVAVLTASVLLLSFVAHAAVFSAFQHYRGQTIAYEELRDSLAKGTAPVNQIQVEQGQSTEDGTMNPIGTPIALLEAPSIGLSEVVLEGSSSDTLRAGIGHRRDSVMPGQAGKSVVLGRQSTYGGPFSQIYRLTPGDEIRVTTGQGESTYRVLGLRRAGDPVPAAPTGKQGRLELQTADGLALFPSGVLHVDAELTTTAKAPGARFMGYPALPDAERAMGANPSAWFTAFFLFVFLAAAAAAVIWLWRSWGRWQAWLIGVPLILALGVATADVVIGALPNLL